MRLGVLLMAFLFLVVAVFFGASGSSDVWIAASLISANVWLAAGTVVDLTRDSEER